MLIIYNADKCEENSASIICKSSRLEDELNQSPDFVSINTRSTQKYDRDPPCKSDSYKQFTVLLL